MKIGIAGAMSMHLLKKYTKDVEIPETYTFPLISLIIDAFIESGHQVVAYTCSWQIKEPFVFQSDALTICVAPRLSKAGRRMFREERNTLKKLMLEHPVDIINAQWSYEFALAALDTNIPHVITVRDHAPTILKYEKTFFTVFRYLMNRRVMKRGKAFIANSAYLKALFSTKNQQKTRIIPNFYKKGLDQHYQNHQEKFNYLISIANQSPQRKNILSSLKAFALIHQEYPDLEYYLLGTGSEEGSWLHQKAQKLGLGEGVRFLGAKTFPEIIEYIKKARILVHPSLEETFGNVVLEAMILGTPVLGGQNSGNVPYLLGHGEFGSLCNVRKPSAIAGELRHMLSTDFNSQELRVKAHKYARDHFSQERTINQLIQYYQDIITR